MNAAPGWERVGASLVVRSGPWAAVLRAGSRVVVLRCNGHVSTCAEWRPLAVSDGGAAVQWHLVDVEGLAAVPRDARRRLSPLIRCAVSVVWGRDVDPATVAA